MSLLTSAIGNITNVSAHTIGFEDLQSNVSEYNCVTATDNFTFEINPDAKVWNSQGVDGWVDKVIFIENEKECKAVVYICTAEQNNLKEKVVFIYYIKDSKFILDALNN